MRPGAKTVVAGAAALLLGVLAAISIGPASAAHTATASVSNPPIVERPIPFGPKRKREMAATPSATTASTSGACAIPR